MPKRQPRTAKRQPDRDESTGNREREPDGAEFPSVSEEPLQPWLEPIGNTGFYQSPTEPVDPRDCDRWPDSPYCDGSGVNLDDFIDLAPDFHGNECEICVTVSPTLAFISLPPYTVCYRKPECREEPGEELPDLTPPMPPGDSAPVPKDPDGLYGGCDGEIYGITLLGMVSTGRPNQPVGEYSFEKETAGTYYVYGPIGPIKLIKLSDDRVTDQQDWGLRIHCKGPIYPYLNFSPYESGTYRVFSMPYLWNISSKGGLALRLLITRQDGRTVDICDNGEPAPFPPPSVPSPPPLNNPPREPCCMNCAEQDRLLRLIAKRIGTEDYPASVPKSLLTDRGSGQQQIESLTQLIGWLTQQIDGLVGEFPININIEDTDPTRPGNQSQKVKIPNIAEAIADLYALSLKNSVDSDSAISFLMRLASEVIGIKNAALITQDYAKANAEFLGYKGNQVKRDVAYAFDPEGLASLEKILNESNKQIVGWENDDKESLLDYQRRLMFAAGIIKAVFFRGKKDIPQLNREVDNLVNRGDEDLEERWREFLRAINNPRHRFNVGDVPQPEIKDLSVPPDLSQLKVDEDKP